MDGWEAVSNLSVCFSMKERTRRRYLSISSTVVVSGGPKELAVRGSAYGILGFRENGLALIGRGRELSCTMIQHRRACLHQQHADEKQP